MTDIVIASAARTRRGAASQNKAKEMLGRRGSGGIARGKPLSLCSFKLAKIAQRTRRGKSE